MSKSSNAVSRCATLLMACTTLASQAAQAGMIVLENQLPVPTSCVVEARYGAEFDPKGLGVLYKAQLLDTLLLPGTTHVAPVRPGQWPVQLRFDGFGAPYTVSPPFIDLELRCRVGEHEHAAVFANPDFLKGGAVVHSADPTSGRDSARYMDAHVLPTYTPTDRTGFVARLMPEDELASAAQLLEGAPVAVELSAMPLLGNGAPLHDAPRWIGRFNMGPPQADGGGSPSRAEDSGYDADEELSQPG